MVNGDFSREEMRMVMTLIAGALIYAWDQDILGPVKLVSPVRDANGKITNVIHIETRAAMYSLTLKEI